MYIRNFNRTYNTPEQSANRTSVRVSFEWSKRETWMNSVQLLCELSMSICRGIQRNGHSPPVVQVWKPSITSNKNYKLSILEFRTMERKVVRFLGIKYTYEFTGNQFDYFIFWEQRSCEIAKQGEDVRGIGECLPCSINRSCPRFALDAWVLEFSIQFRQHFNSCQRKQRCSSGFYYVFSCGVKLLALFNLSLTF